MSQYQPAATALAWLSSKRLQASVGKKQKAVVSSKLSDWTEIRGEPGVSDAASTTLQKVKRGLLQAPNLLNFCLSFEHAPVWLLVLDAEIVNHMWIMGSPLPVSFYKCLMETDVNIKLVTAAIANIVGVEQVSHITTSSFIQPGAVFLASGLIEFVRCWSKIIVNPLLVLCDQHICSRHL
jgi:hypothetical protein